MTLSAAGLLAGALVWSSHRTADADAAGGMDAKSVGQALASSDGAEVRKGAAAAQGVEAAAAVRMLVKKEVLFHVDPSVREAALESLITAFADPLGAEEGATAGALKELALLAAASKAYPKVVAMAAAALAALAEGTSGAGSLPPLAPAEAVAIVSLLSAGGDAGGAQKDAARAVGALAGALVEGAAPVDVQVACATALASLSHFEGTWRVSAAHRAKEFPAAVRGVAALATNAPAGVRISAVSALGQLLAGKGAASLDASTTDNAIQALSYMLHPAAGASREEETAALVALRGGSGCAGTLSAMRVSPTPELVMAALSADEVSEFGAEAGMVVLARMMESSPSAAEEVCVAGGVLAAVRAATAHRSSLAVREATAELLEAAAASGCEDCTMRVGHYATPVILALARTQDPVMQVRALKMMRQLCINNFNKFAMQKGFDVIQELVPLLTRPDVIQQAMVAECLAHLATTENAFYGENARALGEARAMKPLMVLAKSRDTTVHLHAVWALACMTACQGNHVPMRAALDTLLLVLEKGTPGAQRYAVMAVSNMAASDRTRDLLKTKGADNLLRKCAQANSGDRMMNDLVFRTALPNIKRNGTQVFNIPVP